MKARGDSRRRQELAMSFADLSRAALRVQYRIVRYPLGLIEKQMATRLGTRALPRLLYERSLALLDAAAGNVLDAPALAQRGVTKIEQSDNRMRAADLDAEADATVADASSMLKDARAAAAQTEEFAEAKKTRELKQARETADERQRAARKAAEQTADTTKKRADDTARQRKGAAEAAKKHVHVVIHAGEKAAEADAQAKLEHAHETRGAAARKRAEANQLEDLASDEKTKRRSAP
jgi:flagellar biosynthesis GTPase FlhF